MSFPAEAVVVWPFKTIGAQDSAYHILVFMVSAVPTHRQNDKYFSPHQMYSPVLNP